MTLLDDHLKYLNYNALNLFNEYQSLREGYFKDRHKIMTLNPFLRDSFDEFTCQTVYIIHSSVDSILSTLEKDPKDMDRIDYLYEKEINHFIRTYNQYTKDWDYYFSKLLKTLEDCERLVYIRNEYNKTYKS